jgi:acyl-CoA synthetase (AMP-forming)/AMP-acid ligase II
MQIGSLIRRAARYFGAAPCLIEGTRVLSFTEFDAATDRLGNALLARGLQPGDLVGVLFSNSIECLIAYYAVAKAGLVRVGLNTRETLDNHQYKIDDSGARLVIHADIADLRAEQLIGATELAQLIAHGPAGACAVDRTLEAPYRLGYTGGTTGKAKAVTLTTRGELAELSAFLMDLVPNLKPGDTFLHAAPIAHASGAFFLPCLARGATSLVMSKFDPGEFLELAERTQASMTFLVPTMLAMILEQPTIHTANTALHTISYGAAPIAPALLERARPVLGRSLRSAMARLKALWLSPFWGLTSISALARAVVPSRWSRRLFWMPRTAHCPWAKSAKYAAVARKPWPITGTDQRPRRRFFAMVGCIPGMWAAWTKRATSTFLIAKTTCSFRVAITFIHAK